MRFSVLVVDDEKMPREILRSYLPWEELRVDRVEEAEDGAQALEMARLHRPDIVISDVKMPRMTGLEMAAAVRELYPDCKFIFLSGYTDKEYLKGAIKLRAVSYVEKPIDLEELTGVLREVTAELEQQARPDPQLLFYRGEDGDLSSPCRPEVYTFDKAVFTELSNRIRHKRRKEAMDLLAELYRQIRRCESTPPDVVRNLYCRIVFALLAAAESRSITAVTSQSDYLLYTAARQPTLLLLWQSLTDAMQTYFEAVENNAQDLVTRVDTYLEAHLADSDLTVQSMAADLGFVHTYLCSAYKKGSGRTVNHRLTELRMERAKALLADPTLKLYEIAHEVGYTDGKYFVKLFTKEVGIPPRLYRENLYCHDE